ncbi:MAG: DoxX family protein [Methylotenera sp.]|nr:DoxX family protein [Oligoflexia bacterium]
MTIVTVTLQIIISLGLINVWLLRYHKATSFRGGQAKSMKEEFVAYGLPANFTYVIGFLKLAAAILLIAGIWYPVVVPKVALLVSILMIGAILMHLKIKDPLIKDLPAIGVLILSTALLLLTRDLLTSY